MYFQFDLDPYESAYAHLLEHLQHAIQTTFAEEHVSRGLSQTDVANELGVDPSVISRRINGIGNVTIRSICDLYTAMGREPLANFHPFPHLNDGAQKPVEQMIHDPINLGPPTNQRRAEVENVMRLMTAA